MGCFGSDPLPPQPNYGQITRDTLQAQVDLAPQQYAAEAQFQPKYTSLALSNLQKTLYGTPGGMQDVQNNSTAGQTGWYDANGRFISPGQLVQPPATSANGYRNGQPLNINPYYTAGDAPAPGATWRNQGDNFSYTTQQDVPAQQGLTSLMANANTAQRSADVGDVASLGAASRAAILASNPDQAALLAKLNAQANEGLDAGSMLTADQQRAMQQSSRAAFAARGMTGSNAGISDELLKQFNLGQQLLQQRQGFAQSVLGNNQAVVGDAFQQILGRPSTAVGAAQANNSGAGATTFNPSAGIGLAQSNYANQVQYILGQPSTLDNVVSGTKAFSNIAGGAASAFGCWVAREVYGEDNPDWQLFRKWLMTCAPRWLAKAYCKHGERFAAWLKRNPWLKPVIRGLMDVVVQPQKMEYQTYVFTMD